MTKLLRGAGDVARGFRFLAAHPRLWWWVVAPAIITLVFVVGIVWSVLLVSAPLVAFLGGGPDIIQPFVGNLVRAVIVASLSIVGFLVYVSLSGVFAGPFCELLSEAVEERVTGRPPPPFSPFRFLRGLVLGMAHALRRLLVYLFSLGLVVALGSFIPVVGHLIGGAFAGYFAAATAAYDCYDSVFGRRLWRYRRKQEFLRAHRGRTLGLGAAVAALLLIPFLNLVALGVGSVGATLSMLDLERAGAPS